MSISNIEKSVVLAQYAGHETVLDTAQYVDPTTGEFVYSLYDSMPLAWTVHIKMMRESHAYQDWWIKHCLDNTEAPHWGWLDKIYELLTMRPLLVINAVPTRYRGLLVVEDVGQESRIAYFNTMGDEEMLLVSDVDRSIRPTGREVISVSTKEIEA